MGIINKIKEMVGIEEIDDDENEGEGEEVKSIIPEENSAPRPFEPSETPSVKPPVRSESPAPRAVASTGRFTNQMKLIVIEPAGFEESPRLVDNLKARKPVIINLENLETDVARKIFDFLSGATYALNGNVQKIANNIFIFAPENCDVAYNMNKKAQAETPAKSPWK